MTAAKTPVTPSYAGNLTVYNSDIDQGIAANSILANQFQPHEAATPNMTVVIDAGRLPTSTGTLSVAQQSTAAFTAPVTNPRKDAISINRTTGAYQITAGTEAASPLVPQVDTSLYMPIAVVTLTVGMSSITNANIEDVRRATDVPRQAVSGYVSGVTEYLESTVGAHSTLFNISSAIAAAWESVGPTGSGAVNIWTALDSIPSGCKWINLKIYNHAADSGATLDAFQSIYARPTGSSEVADTRLNISLAHISSTNISDPSIKVVSTCDVLVDSLRRFDLYRSTTGTIFFCYAYLIKWSI